MRSLFDGGAGGLSRSSGSCIEKLIASMRNPSTPRSSQKRTTPSSASCTSRLWTLSCGCEPRKLRSEERRVGKGCVSPCGSRWSTVHLKKTKPNEKNKNRQKKQQ